MMRQTQTTGNDRGQPPAYGISTIGRSIVPLLPVSAGYIISASHISAGVMVLNLSSGPPERNPVIVGIVVLRRMVA